MNELSAEGTTAFPTSVVAMLCVEIKKSILTGKYKPGLVLRQEDLAQQYDVSRVPLREAFSKLEAEGYLTLRPRRGYAVSSLNPDEISEVFDLRMLIESHAGQIATKNRTEEDVAEVLAIVETMDAMDPATEGYHDRWCDLNRQFHARLIRSCRRPRLLKLSQQLRDAVEPYIRLESSMTGYSAEPDSDHKEIVAAFAEGNAELVGALSAAHCGRTAARLLKVIRENEAAEAAGKVERPARKSRS
ncbi:GntR family transcriptional regulator [Novosphingobium flavum]|uniref:GntR family transcriptional regulator n=1 Tax=Novosphingobium flavum TaxID=1778672 RepID=A0A7X1FUB9_9SPHN|nr:GntR family transcriptional regulator [Novosphingobium flavum]MBC2667133.1 GntR family transcriptional regulator [Novosphingobium flavum]